jgi:hypothetical protein
MRAIFLALVLAAGLATPAAAGEAVSGRYQVEGISPSGSSYSGTAEITQKSDTNCRILWHYADSDSSGICMVNGNLFTAAYLSGDAAGLLIYRRAADGSLSGVWTVGDGADGTETLTPMR